MRFSMMRNEDAVKKIFGEQIRAIRHKRELSQEALANLCELDRTYIGGVERGERNISLINIVKLADAFEVPASELMQPLTRGCKT